MFLIWVFCFFNDVFIRKIWLILKEYIWVKYFDVSKIVFKGWEMSIVIFLKLEYLYYKYNDGYMILCKMYI